MTAAEIARNASPPHCSFKVYERGRAIGSHFCQKAITTNGACAMHQPEAIEARRAHRDDYEAEKRRIDRAIRIMRAGRGF